MGGGGEGGEGKESGRRREGKGEVSSHHMPHFRNLKIWMCLAKIYNLDHKTQIPSALLLRKASPKGMGMRNRAAAVMTGRNRQT